MIEALAVTPVDLRPGIVVGPAERVPRRAAAVRTDVACLIRVRRSDGPLHGTGVVAERMPHLAGSRDGADCQYRMSSRVLDGWVEDAFRGEFRTRRPAAARMYFHNGGERLWLLDLDFWAPPIDPAALREDEDPDDIERQRAEEATLHFYSCALERVDDLGGAEVSQILVPDLWLAHPHYLPQVWALAATFCKRTGNRFVVADSAPPRAIQEMEWRAIGLVPAERPGELDAREALDWFATSPWSARKGLPPEVALTGAAVLRTALLLGSLTAQLGAKEDAADELQSDDRRRPKEEDRLPIGRPSEVARLLQDAVVEERAATRSRGRTASTDWDLLQEGKRHSPILSCLGVYWPWLKSPRGLDVPPSCAVAGVFARSDRENSPVGCMKPPANEPVRGVLDLSIYVDEEPQMLLERMGINALQSRANRGIVVWGARTSCEDDLWRSVHVRRLVAYIGKQIEIDNQWAVFENNTEDLRVRLVRDVGQFLRKLWEWGAVVGDAPDQAFRVQCDSENNPSWMRDQGMLIVEVWVRPVQANEFIHLNITWGDASVETQG